MIEDQQILIKSLTNPECYNHPTHDIEIIETHISWVILTGPYAYKIKKSVDLGFLNFSSLSSREHYCSVELKLNRRLAPDYYLAVVPITQKYKVLEFDGKGEAIEYALKMVQFPQENQLDRELESGNLNDYSMTLIAEKIYDFHRTINVANNTEKYGELPHIHQPVLDCYDELIKQLNTKEDIRRVILLRDWSCREFERLKEIFVSRKEKGFVRECHGDLHLRNIAIVKQEVIVFDCIEFNENLRWIDLMSEVAFLVMDLDDHQRPDLAFIFLNRYLELTGDYSGLKVFRYYLVYRSIVRAMVSCIRMSQNSSVSERSIEYSEFVKYLVLAEGYIKTPLPKLFITQGLSGSGKTTVSNILMQEFSAIRIRSDIERKRFYDLSETYRGNRNVAQGIYNDEATEQVYQILYKLVVPLLDAGYSVIVDATFLKSRYRTLFFKLAESKGLEFRVFHCYAPIEVLHGRLAQRSQLNTDASDADSDVLDSQAGQSEAFTEEEKKHLVNISTEVKIDVDSLRKLMKKQ